MIKSRRMRCTGHIARIEEKINAYMIMVARQGKRPLGKPKRRCEDSIKIVLREIALGYMDWIHLALVCTSMKLRFA